MPRRRRLSVSSTKRFSVFEFNDEDKRVEKTAKKLILKFGKHKRKHDSSPVTKYKFLECFTGCTVDLEKKSNSPPMYVDVDVDDDGGPIDGGNGGGTKTVCKGVGNELVDVDVDPDGAGHHCTPQEDGALKEEISPLDNHMLSRFSNDMKEPVGMISDDDNDQIEMSSSSTSSVSTLLENEVPSEKQVLEFVSVGVGHEIDYINMKVVVFADFILCGDTYCTESRITFSVSCVRVEGSTINGVKGTFNAEWTIGDILNIESEWCGRVETAMVNLYLNSKASKQAGNANETSGIEKLKFAVCDPHWQEGQEAIKSLDVRYKDIWNVTFNIDWEKDEDAFFQHRGMVISKPYFPVHDEPFEDVIYPKGDPDAVSIGKRDVELLQPETFINDTIIDFYIKYLKNKIQPKDQHRFHFFNSFFFRKLADLDKDPCSACEGRAAFQRVRKWTRKVNLFEKDYIFIPVNYSLHWSLIVICHPGEVANSRDDESENSLKVPCVLHMDSIRGSHRGLKNLFQSYLYEEWKERHNETEDGVSSKFLHLQFVPLELPQQENSFDCGLFLLHYVELFLEEAPTNFSPFKISKFSNFLARNWFLPAEASLKRAHIQRLILEILEHRSQKVLPVDSTDKHPCSQFLDTNEQETGVDFPEKGCSSTKTCQRYSSSPDTELGIQISVSAMFPLRVVQQQIKEEGSKSEELFEPGTSARSFFNENNWQRAARHWRGSMSPVKEAEETGQQITCSSSAAEGQWEIAGLTTESRTTKMYSSRNFRSLGTPRKQKYIHLDELYDNSSSSGTSNNGSCRSSEIGISEDYLHLELDRFGHLKENDKQESSSTSSEDLAACVVEDSLEANCMHEVNVGKGSPSSFHSNGNGNKRAPSVDEFDSAESILRKDNWSMRSEYLALGEQAVKKPKLKSSGGRR